MTLMQGRAVVHSVLIAVVYYEEFLTISGLTYVQDEQMSCVQCTALMIAYR